MYESYFWIFSHVFISFYVLLIALYSSVQCFKGHHDFVDLVVMKCFMDYFLFFDSVHLFFLCFFQDCV